MGTPLNINRPTHKLYEPNYYDATIVSIAEKENKFYNAEEPEQGSPTQLEIKFEFTDTDGEQAFIRTFLNPVLTLKSRFFKFCTAVIPGFAIENPVCAEDFVGKKLRINITNKTKEDGTIRNVVADYVAKK